MPCRAPAAPSGSLAPRIVPAGVRANRSGSRTRLAALRVRVKELEEELASSNEQARQPGSITSQNAHRTQPQA